MAASNLRRRRMRFLRRRRRREHAAAMTVMEHLGELRTRLMVSAAAFVAVSIGAFVYYEPLFDLLIAPLCAVGRDVLGPRGCELSVLRPTEAFQFRLKMTALAGLVLASPVWLYQIYAFIVPALTPREKRYTIPFLVCSTLLFLGGTLFAYSLLSRGLRFLLTIGGEQLDPLIRAEDYLNFVGLMFIAFGLAFELPLILVFLGLVGVVSVEQLRRHRRTAIVSISLLAALATPSQDPYTMLAMLVPLYLLYELVILILRLVERRRRGRASEA